MLEMLLLVIDTHDNINDCSGGDDDDDDDGDDDDYSQQEHEMCWQRLTVKGNKFRRGIT